MGCWWAAGVGAEDPVSPAELADRDEQEKGAEQDLDPAQPGGRPGVVAIHGRGDEKHGGSRRAESEQPAEQERCAVGAAVRGGQHQDHGDDRDGADGDAHRGRQRFADRFTHRLAPRFVGGCVRSIRWRWRGPV
jgi:hypothetical protein